MSKVRTFSRYFPKGHPKEGEQTHFVEQIWNSLRDLNLSLPKSSEFSHEFMWSILPLSNFGCKHHTIRGGQHFKVGDYFSPRVWSNKPYTSKQIIIAPDIQIKQVWDITFVQSDEHLQVGENCYYPCGYEEMIKELAKNDGLSVEDFKAWFKKPFTGQILCWSESVGY